MCTSLSLRSITALAGVAGDFAEALARAPLVGFYGVGDGRRRHQIHFFAVGLRLGSGLLRVYMRLCSRKQRFAFGMQRIAQIGEVGDGATAGDVAVVEAAVVALHRDV